MLTQLAWVGLGGAAGSMLRYAVGQGLAAWLGAAIPFGTLAVNVAGCLAAGYMSARLIGAGPDHPGRLLMIVGFLGGLTTFSAFGVETMAFAQGDRLGLAALNIAANLVLGLGAAALGFVLARM